MPPLDCPDNALSHSKHAPACEARRLLCPLAGVDVVATPGLHASTVPTILAEIGLDMGKWPHEKAFCAWSGLAPRPEISGGKVLRRSTLQTRTRARSVSPAAIAGVRCCHRLTEPAPWIVSDSGKRKLA